MVVVAAGQRPTAADLADLFARKTVDESLSSSTTYQNDDGLFVTGAANAVYVAWIHLVYQSPTAADFQYRFSVPSGATLPGWSFLGVNASSVFVYGAANSGGVSGLGGTAADQVMDAWGPIIMGSTAGTIQVQWSQAVSNATATIVRAGSYLHLRRVS